MKKTFTLILFLVCLALSASAQDKKTWDFTLGVSAETIANLEADPNWTVTYNDDGSFKQANEATKLSGEFKANGEIIQELAGLSLGTAGLSKSNNVILMPNRFRINRDKMELNFPQLKNGQTITIVGRSANSTAENRGIKASYDYMQRIEGPEDDLIRASMGSVTNKWQVVTDSPDPVDIKFTMITGGVDFTLFMIDEGDVVPTVNVAYLYDGTQDGVYRYLESREETNLTAINVTTESVTAEQLQQYDVTIVSQTMPADNAAAAALKEALPWTPVLNLNAQLYPAWGYGEAIACGEFAMIKQTKNALLKDAELVEGDGMIGLPLGAATFGVKLGDYFAGDPIVATDMEDEEAVMIHTHNINHNGYVFLPYTAEMTEPALKVLDNAILALQSSKKDITAATAPTISREYKDLHTLVTIKAPNLPKAQVYYTIDGSDPTVSSTLYTDVIDLYQPCTLKASAIAEGYTLSPAALLEVEIKQQPKTPAISYEQQDGKTIVTLSGDYGDDDVVWYNFEDEVTTDTLKSTKYVEPFAITMPQNITTFAVAGQSVWSEPGTQRVLVRNPRVVIDVAAHFSAPQWTADNNPNGLAVANGKGMFTWGASAVSMWREGTGTEETTVDPETGDEIVVITHQPEDMRDLEVVNEAGDNPQWALKSRGTCLIWQNTGAQTSNFGQDSNYNPSASTDVDPLFPVTKNDIQFYKFQAGETPNASIETLNKYQAPLDVVVLANMAGGPLLAQVSPDGEQWTTIGQIEKTGFARMWGKHTMSYDGTDEVFVRITQEEISAGAKVFDIYIANQGQQSLALLEELNRELDNADGIQELQPTTKTATVIYNLNGVRLNGTHRGVNIIRHSDGTIRKVMVK